MRKKKAKHDEDANKDDEEIALEVPPRQYTKLDDLPDTIIQ